MKFSHYMKKIFYKYFIIVLISDSGTGTGRKREYGHSRTKSVVQFRYVSYKIYIFTNKLENFGA